MSRSTRLLRKILRGRSDANIFFGDLCALLQDLGFKERIRGRHYLYRKEGVVEKINLQRDDGHAKPYQVRQVRRVILKYKLGEDD